MPGTGLPMSTSEQTVETMMLQYLEEHLFAALDNAINRPLPEEHAGYELRYYVVGDDIFPLKPWLLKPYPGKNISEEQAIFNYRLSRARRTIENAFGIMSSRFRIFRKPIIADLDLIELIVQATTSLHNYLLLPDNGKYTPAGFVHNYSDSGDIDGDWRKDGESYNFTNQSAGIKKCIEQC